MTRQFPFLTERFIAHRGLHDKVLPENSMAAARAAIDKGFGIELDVQLSKDGEAMVFHDPDLKRMCGRDEQVIDCLSSELQQYTLLDSDETIPTLEDFLAMVDGRVPVLVEVKNEGRIGRLERRVAEIVRKYPDKVAVMSFNPLSMAWFRNKAPEFPRGQLYIEWNNKADTEDMSAIRKLQLFMLYKMNAAKPDFVARTARAWTPELLAGTRQWEGQPALCWGAFAPDDHEYAIAQGVDNVIFEHYLP